MAVFIHTVQFQSPEGVGRLYTWLFQVIAETGQTGQLHYDGMANGGHLFRPEDKDELDFSEPALPFYAQESTTRMTRNTTIAFHHIPARWFMCPLISTLFTMSSALRALPWV